MKLIDPWHISDLIIKLYVFISFKNELFPYDVQNGIRPRKRYRNDNESHFLTICSYLNNVKKTWLGLWLWCLTPLSTIFQLSWRLVLLVEET